MLVICVRSSLREVTLQMKDLFLLEVGPRLAFYVDVKNLKRFVQSRNAWGTTGIEGVFPSCYVIVSPLRY